MKRAETFFIAIGVGSLFLFLVLIAAHVAILLWDEYRSTHRSLTPHQLSAYRHMSRDQIQDLLAWTANPGFVYEPWLGFKERARSSTYVNVSDLGIRFNRPGENPDRKIEGSVWFFGGSTTFGWGVADNETIPAQLENLIKQPVVNLGHAHYFSAHENFLLSSLLKSGFKPKTVIFLDGINEMCEVLPYRMEFTRLFSKAQTYSWDPAEVFKPLFRVAQKLETWLQPPRRNVLPSEECVPYKRPLSLATVVAANLAERRDICGSYNLKCHNFVQPFAGVHGMHEDRVTLPAEDRKQMSEKFDYLSPTWKRFGAAFINDSLDCLHEHAYVDGTHYSASASRSIAKAIAGHIGSH
jgi:hypothetical protein